MPCFAGFDGQSHQIHAKIYESMRNSEKTKDMLKYLPTIRQNRQK